MFAGALVDQPVVRRRTLTTAYRGPFDGFHATEVAVSKTCLVRFDNNQYRSENARRTCQFSDSGIIKSPIFFDNYRIGVFVHTATYFNLPRLAVPTFMMSGYEQIIQFYLSFLKCTETLCSLICAWS